MMEAFLVLLCVAFGVVIGAVAMSYHDWRMEVTREMHKTDWQETGYPVRIDPGKYMIPEQKRKMTDD